MSRLRSLLLPFALVLWVPWAAHSQTDCNSQNCTFTLTFGHSVFEFVPEVGGAPFSGQLSQENVRTLPGGAHTTSRYSGAMSYRDSKGRVRTEYSYYDTPADQPARPDNFTAVEIRDPVAGFDYILDSVNHVAHRMKYDPGPVQKFQGLGLPFGAPTGQVVEQVGPKAIAGIAAIGTRTTRTGPGATPGAPAEERWFDPRTGVTLLDTSTNPSGDVRTETRLNYSNSEPDPALFKIPDGYQLVDETGTFKVVHPHSAPGGAVSSSGSQCQDMPCTATVNLASPPAQCQDGSCAITFNLAPPRPVAAFTGAPYSGRPVNEVPARTLPNGNQIPARTAALSPAYRDSQGRIRTERSVQVGGGRGMAAGTGRSQHEFNIVEIDDPVAGYQYILDSVNRVAHRVAFQPRKIPFTVRTGFQPAGTRTAPNGMVVTDEDLGTQTISGVSAAGHRTTQTSPPGTFQGNDKPIVDVNERWIDPQTGIELLAKQSGSNPNVRTMQDYKAVDPDPSLFQIPSDYRIIDETGTFSIIVPAI